MQQIPGVKTGQKSSTARNLNGFRRVIRNGQKVHSGTAYKEMEFKTFQGNIPKINTNYDFIDKEDDKRLQWSNQTQRQNKN